MSVIGSDKYLTKPKPGVMLNPLHPLSRGLVGLWLFNEGSGSNVRDISRQDHHINLVNMSANSQDTGWSNSNLKFDGTSTYGNITSLSGLPSGNEDYTYGMRFKMDTLIDHNALWSIGNNLNLEIIYPTVMASKRLWIVHFGAGNDWDTGIDLEAETWYEFMTTWNGTDEIVYINGIPRASHSPAGYTVNLQSFEIGHCFYRLVGNRHLDAAINFFYGYNRVLSAKEAKQRYLDPFCHFTPSPIKLTDLAQVIMNQFQRANIGADLYNGTLL